MMIGGYTIDQYHQAAQPWESPNWQTTKAANGKEFEMVCGFSDKYIEPNIIEKFLNDINESYERHTNLSNS